ncbi:MAG: hypothetical protein ACYDIA_18145 [Candidatus Humimicrobiaceae bacterium]
MKDKDKYKVVRLNCKLFPVISEEINELKKVGANLIQIQGDEIPVDFMDADVLMVVSAKVKDETIKQLYNVD